MVNVKSPGTRDVPLKLAKRITEQARELWKSGEFLEKVAPITQELWIGPLILDRIGL